MGNTMKAAVVRKLGKPLALAWDNPENINDTFARMEDGKIDGRIVANLQ